VLKGPARKVAAVLTMRTIMPKISPRRKVFIQRLLTRFLLLPKLSKAPFCSMIMVGITSEKIMAMIIPGTMKRKNPSIIRIPAINWAASIDGSLDTAKLKLTLRFELPFSIWSEAFLITMPVTVVPTIQNTRPEKTPIRMTFEISSRNHGANSSLINVVLGE